MSKEKLLNPNSSSPNFSTPHSSLENNSSLLTTMRWLITGGCGFIGTSLIKRLVEEGGHSIRVIDNLSVGTREDLATVCNFTEVDISSLLTSDSSLNKNSSLLTPDSSLSSPVELIVGDILDEDLALQVAKDIDIIIHLAANTGVPISVAEPRKDCMANVIGTFNMLEAARHNKVERFIFASSGAPAGEVEPPIHENLPAKPVSPYGASKLAGEGYCSAYYRSFGIKTVSLRFGNVYGPGSTHKSSVVAKFIKQALAGETLEIYGDGTQTRDFIYIDDLVNAILLAVNPRPASPHSSLLTPISKNTPDSSLFIEHSPNSSTPNSKKSSSLDVTNSPDSSLLTPHSVWGEIFQIATSRETTLDEITELLLKIFVENGIKEPRVEKTEPRLGDVKRNFSDTSKAKKVLGWECGWPLDKGLQNTVERFLGK